MLPMGFYPFWFWNDKLSENEIRWQIDQMAEQGLCGFFIHSRQGMQTPYMSETFFRMIDVAINQAEKRNMMVNLYDEYPYPSGVAGGEVVMGRPQFFATRLLQKTIEVSGGHIRYVLPQGKILHCSAYPLSGSTVDWDSGLDLRDSIGIVLCSESYNDTSNGFSLSNYNHNRYFASRPHPVLDTILPDGKYYICIASQVVVEDHKYWQNFVDELNPEAIREFIRCTHERYQKHFGEHFGKRIYSIFTDETSAFWSDRVPQAFLDQYKYDLLPLLPAIEDPSHPHHVKVKYDLQQLLYQMFCQSYDEPISDWCRAAGIRYTGEKTNLRMAQLQYMDIAGCDTAHIKAGNRHLDLLAPLPRNNAKVASSAAYFYKQEGALCECFHSLGWGGTLQDARWLVDGLALLGIKYFVSHGAFYSAHAMKKHDAPPSFFFQMPYWKHFGLLPSRIKKLESLFGRSHMHADVLVYEPSSGIPDKCMLSTYKKLLHAMMETHIDYLLVDTDILEKATLKEDGMMQIQDICVPLLVLPPMQIIEPQLQDWLNRFQSSGGRVISCNSEKDIPDAILTICENVKPILHIEPVKGDTRKLWSAMRIHEKHRGWLLLNTSSESMEVSLDAGMPLVEYPLEPGLPSMLHPAEKPDNYHRTVEPFEAFWIETTEETHPAQPLPEVLLPTDGIWTLRHRDANVLRLYEWVMSLKTDDGKRLTHSATVNAIPLSNQLEDGGFSFEPSIQRDLGSMPKMELPELQVEYQSNFILDYPEAVHLVLERGAIIGDWNICINDTPPFGFDVFSETSMHMRGCSSVDITALLKNGKNSIKVSVRTNRDDGGLCNALYLAGNFGVACDTENKIFRLTTPVTSGRFEAYVDNALPYYSGVIDYESNIEFTELPDADNVLLRLDTIEPFEEMCEISINGGEWLPMPWSPHIRAVPIATLRNGKNHVIIRVYTTRIRSFEGQWFDTTSHKSRNIY